MPELLQIHPGTQVTDPAGDPVIIDTAILPVVRQLWNRGWTTLGSCQDLGEAARHGGAPGGERTATYWAGYAWLKLGNDDADAFLTTLGAHPLFAGRLSPGSGPERWCCFTYRDASGLYTSTQVFLPADQVSDLALALATCTPPVVPAE